MGLLLIGFLLGILALLVALGRERRSREKLENDNRILGEEKQIAIDFMHSMAEALADNPSRELLYERIVQSSILCTGALSACIFEQTADGQMRGVAVQGLFPPHRPLDDPSRGKLSTRAKFIEEVLKSETFPLGEGLVGRVALTRKGELLARADLDPMIVRHTDPALKVRSVIAVPLLFHDRFFGVLAVANTADDEPFNETDFRLVQSLAEQAALALYHAEFLHLQIERQQLDLDLSLASGIQQMLLPSSAPQIPGLEVDARYAPAQQIGGDLYDLIALPGGKLGLAIADVSGKGIPASLLMAICQSHLRQIAPRFGSPAAVLAELDSTIGGSLKQGMFISMIYAVVDPVAGRVTFARAGHELPIIVHAGSTGMAAVVDLVGSEGMPLGLATTDLFVETLEDRTLAFGPGEIFVLYTDGITEAVNKEDKEYSSARLIDSLRTLCRGNARSINDGVMAEVSRFVGDRSQRDDYTLVTVRRV